VDAADGGIETRTSPPPVRMPITLLRADVSMTLESPLNDEMNKKLSRWGDFGEGQRGYEGMLARCRGCSMLRPGSQDCVNWKRFCRAFG